MSPPGEKQRRNYIAVGGHHQPARRRSHDRHVIPLGQIVVLKRRCEQLRHQLRHGSATSAVAHVYAALRNVKGLGEEAVVAFLVHAIHAAASFFRYGAVTYPVVAAVS